MRVVTYNILDGGEGRADPLAEVLEAQQPDVVTLIEADVPAVVQRIASRLKLDFIIGPGLNHSVAVLSRWPIVRTINRGLLSGGISRGFLEAVVAVPGGGELPIFALHLPAGALDADESARLKDLTAMLNLTQPYRENGTRHLLCGDFNSNAIYHPIDVQNLKPATKSAWAANGDRLPHQVMAELANAGYLDTLHAVVDEREKFAGSFTTQQPGQRVDYVFAFGFERSNIVAAWVERDRLAKYASDHFPVGAEISL